MKAFVILYVLMSFFNSVFAQGRPVRSTEVDNFYKTKIETFLQRTLPDSKYIVSVRVIPQLGTTSRKQSDYLPYFHESTADLDPWENPDYPFFALLKFISTVNVKVSLDKGIRLEDSSLFKENLYKEADLILGRDELTIDYISFPRKAHNFEDYFSNPVIVSSFFGILIISMVIFLTVRNVKGNLGLSQNSNSSNSSSSNTQPSMSPSVSQVQTSTHSTSATMPSFVELSSSLKELPKKIEMILSDNSFPTTKDMVIFETLLKEDPKGFSYLMSVFPREVRMSVFSLGRNDEWIQAFCEVGLPSTMAVLAVEKILQARNQNSDPDLESLLTLMWRCSDNLIEILKDQEIPLNLSLLAMLPKDFSLPIARKLVPGNWAAVLSSKTEVKIEKSVIAVLKKRCLQVKPLFAQDHINQLVSRKDLLSYLDYASPDMEEEVYQVISHELDLSEIRPPFFEVFYLGADQVQAILRSFSLQLFSIAILDIPRSWRTKLEEHLQPKQKEMLIEYLKKYDKERPSIAEIVAQRKSLAKIARVLKEPNQPILTEEAKSSYEKKDNNVNQNAA